MKAYQYDRSGFFVCETEADESPLEPGVYLLPAGCTLTPPGSIPAGYWPRWNGSSWSLAKKPAAKVEEESPAEKLRDFLNNNPDVAALLQSGAGAANVDNP